MHGVRVMCHSAVAQSHRICSVRHLCVVTYGPTWLPTISSQSLARAWVAEHKEKSSQLQSDDKRCWRAKMVPGQLQPQLLLDQCLTEESRNSELRSPRPLTKLIKTWTQILSDIYSFVLLP
ncbi:uncharacterized protein ACIBXB_017482 isoform 2-T2 [Morphnus guianensis]